MKYMGQGLKVGGMVAMALEALISMLVLPPTLQSLPHPRPPLSGREQSLPSTKTPWGAQLHQWHPPPQAHMHSHHHLSLQERIVKVMDDYQIMDEFLYNLSTDDFNDK